MSKAPPLTICDAPGTVRFVSKPWGWERWLTNSREQNYCFKELCIAAGQRGSIHSHPVKAETILVVSGRLLFEVFAPDESSTAEDPVAWLVKKFELTAGNFVELPPTHLHRLTGLTNVVLHEASTFHDDDDVIRYREVFH